MIVFRICYLCWLGTGGGSSLSAVPPVSHLSHALGDGLNVSVPDVPNVTHVWKWRHQNAAIHPMFNLKRNPQTHSQTIKGTAHTGLLENSLLKKDIKIFLYPYFVFLIAHVIFNRFYIPNRF